MRRLLSLLLLIPYAAGWLAGALVLICALIVLALIDGYQAGRKKA